LNTIKTTTYIQNRAKNGQFRPIGAPWLNIIKTTAYTQNRAKNVQFEPMGAPVKEIYHEETH
jgi:hypothetical protein